MAVLVGYPTIHDKKLERHESETRGIVLEVNDEIGLDRQQISFF